MFIGRVYDDDDDGGGCNDINNKEARRYCRIFVSYIFYLKVPSILFI